MVSGSVPETRYARTTDGLDIAYQTLGDGGVDILKLASTSSRVFRTDGASTAW